MNFKIFKNFPELHYGISERKDGSMRIIGIAEQDKFVQENRQRFLEGCSIKGKVVVPHLTHSNKVVAVTQDNSSETFEADGFITSLPGIFLTITVADCFPLYFYDPIQKIVGLAHAGWRGVGRNIVKNVIRAFVKSFSSKPKDILLGIGPGIRQCHFTVKQDVAQQVLKAEPEAAGGLRAHEQFIEKKSDNEYAIDLEGIIMEQARNEGVVNIEASRACTYCMADTYFSYRRDKPEILETMLAFIGRR